MTKELTDHFHKAAFEGDLDLTRALLRGDPTLALSKEGNGLTALHFAANKGHRDVVEFLLSNGANVNARSNDGSTALHYAAAGDQKEVVGRQEASELPRKFSSVSVFSNCAADHSTTCRQGWVGLSTSIGSRW